MSGRVSGRSRPVDGFALTYDDVGAGSAVVLLHGWPGDRTDYRRVLPRVTPQARVVVPDLRGFGESDKHDAEPAEHYSAQAQARSVAALIEELELGSAVVGGYDVGSGVAHALVRARPDLVRALVLAPPLPGIDGLELGPQGQREFWYQSFHRLPLAESLIDGNQEAVRAYLEYFWQQWSGPDGAVDVGSDEFDRLVRRYAPPGAFRSSIAWYRAGSDAYDLGQPAHGRPEQVPTTLTLLWPMRTRCSRRPGRTPWASTTPTPRCDRSRASATSSLLEHPEAMSAAILDALGTAGEPIGTS